MARQPTKGQFLLCVKNDDCEDLEKFKVYRAIPDDDAEKEGYMRVIDESGEDYLYPGTYFVQVHLPREAEQALLSTG
jgi:hypothetical protein